MRIESIKETIQETREALIDAAMRDKPQLRKELDYWEDRLKERKRRIRLAKYDVDLQDWWNRVNDAAALARLSGPAVAKVSRPGLWHECVIDVPGIGKVHTKGTSKRDAVQEARKALEGKGDPKYILG